MNFKILVPIYLFTFFTTFCGNAFAQDPSIRNMESTVIKNIKRPTSDSNKIWIAGARFDLNIAQGSQSNWAAGGDNFSFSINSYFGFYAFYKKEKYNWDNTIDLNYGLVNTTTLGTRKNDDRIDILSKAGYELTKRLSLTALINFHSQFSKGYEYTDSSRKLLSNFLSPGYVLLGIGIDYKPAEGLSIFVSPITTRWTIVSNDSLAAQGKYGVAVGAKSKTEVGAFVSVNYLKAMTKTITYKGRLDLFSNYEHDPQNVDVSMNNMFTAKLSKVLTGTLALDLIYDDDVKLFGPNHDSPGLQLKSQIGIGLSVKL